MMLRRYSWRLGGALLVFGFLAAFFIGSPHLRLGIAYKAKQLCSAVFIAGQSPEDALEAMERGDLQSLRLFGETVAQSEVTASFFGLFERTARYRGETGCALTVEDASIAATTSSAISPPTTSKAFDVSINPHLAPILDKAFAEPNADKPQRTRAVVILHEGQIVAERYAPPIGPETPLLGWSMTKSVLNALVSVLVKEGRFEVNAPIHVPEWGERGDARNLITLDQLLRMSSGLTFDEDASAPTSDVTQMLFHNADMAAYAANKALEAPPGARWHYSSGTSNIISRALRHVMDAETYRTFPHTALFGRIGMRSAVFETDPSGTFVASSYIHATARDWARFGALYLNDGTWEGERILPEGWVDYTRSPTSADGGEVFGAHFWLDIPQYYDPSDRVLPSDALHAIGHEAQFITILPSHNAVIVRLGKTREDGAWDHGAFVASVMDALEAGD